MAKRSHCRKTGSCEGKPHSDYHHRYVEMDFGEGLGYDPRLKRYQCSDCGIVEYRGPRPKVRSRRWKMQTEPGIVRDLGIGILTGRK